MKVRKRILLNTTVELLYIVILFMYVAVITPFVLDIFNIFQSFMFKYTLIALVFFTFGLLLAVKHFLNVYSQRTYYTFCIHNIIKGVAILFLYGFIFFDLLLFEVLNQNEVLQIVFLLFTIFIGYSTLSSFKLTVRINK